MALFSMSTRAQWQGYYMPADGSDDQTRQRVGQFAVICWILCLVFLCTGRALLQLYYVKLKLYSRAYYLLTASWEITLGHLMLTEVYSHWVAIYYVINIYGIFDHSSPSSGGKPPSPDNDFIKKCPFTYFFYVRPTLLNLFVKQMTSWTTVVIFPENVNN